MKSQAHTPRGGVPSSTHASVVKMTQLAILTAIVILLQCFGGLLRLPFMGTAGNLVLIPIALGAILLGGGSGAWLGFVCGAVVLLFGVLGMDPFTHLLFEVAPFMTVLICLVKTTLAGFLSALVFRALAKKNEVAALFLSAGLVPVVNTGVFVLGCLIILEKLRYVVETLELMPKGGNAVAFLFLGLAGVNFLFELGVTLVLTPAVQRVLYAVRGRGKAASEKDA